MSSNSKKSTNLPSTLDTLDFSRFEKLRDLGFQWFGAYLLCFQEFESVLRERKAFLVLKKHGADIQLTTEDKEYLRLAAASVEKRRAFYYRNYIALDFSREMYLSLDKKNELGEAQNYTRFLTKELRLYPTILRVKARVRSRGAI